MKLWLKISLICIGALLLIVGTCNTILIVVSKDNIIHLTLNSALTEQNNLQASFSGMVSYYSNDNMDAAAKRSMAKYCFTRFSGNTSVLVSGNDTIYSNISLSPEKILPLTSINKQEHYMGEIDGRNILIVGEKVTLLSNDYSVYTVQDITSVYNSIDKMIWEFGLVSFVCIVLGISLIVFLVRFATRPLKSLGHTARRIAKGDYGERATISTRDEVGALAQDFNVMAEAVQSHINELKENSERQLLFIGGISHEFKTPLTSVIGHSETLLYTKMPEDIVQNSLTHIHEQCKWLERLTQKLLRLITLQEQIELKEVSVCELLAAVKSSTEKTLRQREITLQTACDNGALLMDFDLMLSLLINLVDNAAKASKPGQSVQINSYKNVIEVTDHGIGIPNEEISRILEPFYMVDRSRNKRKGGSGLGLALVKRIADAHGAQIDVESILGQGTTVRIIFPVNK
jgi:two-component system phosphate regulon sensor histidine kinase PhoR